MGSLPATLVLLALSAGDGRTELRVVVPPPLPVGWDIRALAGWTRIEDKTRVGDEPEASGSDAGLVTYGAALRLYPIGGLVVGFIFQRGKTEIDSPQVTPKVSDITWSQWGGNLGWEIDLEDSGDIQNVTLRVGYVEERWSSPDQEPNQLTPSFTLGSANVGLEALLRHRDLVDVRVGAAGIPYVTVDEDYETNGKDPLGFGVDVNLEVDFDLGDVFGRWGHVLIGAAGQIGLRWITYDGTGTRIQPGGSTPVSDVSQRYIRYSVQGVLTWRLPQPVPEDENTEDGPLF